jgi:hypothetical protein
MPKVRVQRLAIAGSIAALLLAAAPGLALAGDTHPISDGAAKGQANEGVVQQTSGGSGAGSGAPTGAYLRKKLPGKMKSGTLTVTHTATGGSGGGATTGTHSGDIMGNHKD